jgi:AraC family transcriptional regulator
VLRDIGFELYRLVTCEPAFIMQRADDLVMALAHHVTAKYATGGTPLPRVGALSIETILDDFRENAPTPYSVSRLVARCGISREHFTRQVRSISGLSPYRMIVGSRIELAKHLLERREASLSEIAYDTGFVDQSHLSRVFKRCTGITPGRYLARRPAAHA